MNGVQKRRLFLRTKFEMESLFCDHQRVMVRIVGIRTWVL